MRRTVHQWRDWLLEYIGDDRYELIEKGNLSVFRTITAKNAMDAENECQLIIKNSKEKKRLNLPIFSGHQQLIELTGVDLHRIVRRPRQPIQFNIFTNQQSQHRQGHGVFFWKQFAHQDYY